MGDVMNLRLARKRAGRAAAATEAAANRAAHGVPKGARDLAGARRAKAERELDGHEREGTPEG